MFNTVSARQIQRGYKKVLEDANKSKEPIVVMSNNKPLGAIISLDLLEKMQLEELLNQALIESRQGKTKIIRTKRDLDDDLEDLKRYVLSKD
ncbi:MAG: type II toxin-antitoxin system Phd/YefM family antitoxin [Candidatus Levybacteria bacterium]|nr:type II toxin-antitoxin system Phd/YefM family antitoxin [Candidatus Levybacteria bacterium]